MGLLNSIGQGLSQAGYAAGDIFAKQAAAEQSSIMELERQKRLAEFQAERKNAPLKRYGAILKDEAGKDVTEPGKTEVIDAPSEFIGGENAGIENAKGWINTPPTTRKRTQAEAMTAANARAMQEDPEAYAEYESRIGKPLREERKIDAIEAKNEASAKAAAAKEETARLREERRAADSERRDATARYVADKHMEGIMARLAKGQGDKEDRVIVHQFLQQFDRKIQVNDNEIRSLRSQLKDPLMSDEDKAGIRAEIEKYKKANENLTSAQYEYAKASGVKLPDSMVDESGKPKPVAPAPKPAASGRPPLDSFFKK